MAYNPLRVTLSNIIPLTEARDHFSQIVNEVQKDKLYVLTKGGKPAVAIVDVKYLEQITGGNVNTSHVEQEIQKNPAKVGRPEMLKHEPTRTTSTPSVSSFTPTPQNTPLSSSVTHPTPPAPPKPFTPPPVRPKPFTPPPMPPKPAPMPLTPPIEHHEAPKPEFHPNPPQTPVSSPTAPLSSFPSTPPVPSQVISPKPVEKPAENNTTLKMPPVVNNAIPTSPIDKSSTTMATKPEIMATKPTTMIDVHTIDDEEEEDKDTSRSDNSRVEPDDKPNPAQYSGGSAVSGHPEPDDMLID
ncbi:TPA: prevent-host-death family protein [Candidatus Berkelbacteria bacterium]|uniref:Putative pectinesterase/pectinesterase inhibitor 44-like protein n=1 Tax=Berkelbacteria bacterium GW2011_GWE1_39_12 TaxID=1618337 RepID=A0A0G4B2D6_9BACT|nr:MAG: putative pectinesterase/pectinesterase inhibitor 44-like protein [Berkelbacteria bacterium GW2011_GWE1_39_12]HBO60703.1 prevent-host-death family protein [Candidatus Berkelbacteria bacterium]